jgi:hypothetical protein
MSQWAVGVRSAEGRKQLFDAAFASGAILRTHVLRPTWHLVSADDISWMLDLTAPQIYTAMRSRHQQLGLTSRYINKCLKAIEKALSGGVHLTRKELVTALARSGIQVGGDNAPAHIMLHAELEKLVCSGMPAGKEQTFALFHERVQNLQTFPRAEAIARLADTYFQTRGPATIEDFSWWSGLSKRDATAGIEAIKARLDHVTVSDQIYWFNENHLKDPGHTTGVYLLPAYDEFLLSYQDRTAVLPKPQFTTVISNNGIFRPIVVTNGTVSGIWSSKNTRKAISITIQHFTRPGQKHKDAISSVAGQFGVFHGKEIEVIHTH